MKTFYFATPNALSYTEDMTSESLERGKKLAVETSMEQVRPSFSG